PTLHAAGSQIALSRQFLDDSAEDSLLAIAHEADLSGALSRLFAGELVNPSEARPALHWALRSQTEESGLAETVRASSQAALLLASDLQNGRLTASDDRPFSAIVHIGIGGSDFGPRLVADAFNDNKQSHIDLRFCANLDPLDLSMALNGLDPARTLVIGISKSFGTEETLYNLSRARDWLKTDLGDNWPKHLALVTANPDRAKA
ncbi:unnamed protein product, partial [Chrysoparadoxa australica]